MKGFIERFLVAFRRRSVTIFRDGFNGKTISIKRLQEKLSVFNFCDTTGRGCRFGIF